MHEPAQVVAGGAGERGGGRWSLRRHAPKGRLRPHAPESLGRFADFAPPVGVGGVDVSVRVLQRGGGRPSGRDGGAPTASLGASLPLLHEANRKRELALINSRPGADQQLKDASVAKVQTKDTLLEHAWANLQSIFRLSSLRQLQREAIECVLKGKDVVVCLATGGGKSLCYQLPATVLPGITVVVSPLVIDP